MTYALPISHTINSTGLGGNRVSFHDAYRKVQKFEGGYVHDPTDRGGETYRGIARRYHPGWTGWPIIDRIKRQHGTPRTNAFLEKYAPELDGLTEAFYRQWWRDKKADQLLDQRVAEVYYDFSILAERSGVRQFKRTLRTLGHKHLDDTGTPTQAMVDAANKTNPVKLVNRFVEARLVHHQQDVARNPAQKKFMDNWTKRALKYRVGGNSRWPVYALGAGVVIGLGLLTWHYLTPSESRSTNGESSSGS
ncbi:MAG TPA: hypothetical protein DCE41_00855 [Cytophagales bacterium]|nr:hypothetical protein [Cytophagales bacterium]